MTYMENLEARLKTFLAGLPDEEQAILIREVKTIALESYRNGQKAGAPKSKRETATAAPAKKNYKR